ncbi:MAG: hypothetical protein LUD68_00815, partial [Rikenellaceae bacterium]|nr:hypothetical protein [Rikenellaceae bacterium]
KKLTSLLIGMLVLIRSVRVRRVVPLAGPESLPESPFFTSEAPAADTAGYVLQLDYRDPFLEEKSSRKPPLAPVVTPATAPAALLQPAAPPPEVRFKGVIRQAGTLFAIVENAGKSEIMRAGETIETYTLHTITADSIGLKKGGCTWMLPIQ